MSATGTIHRVERLKPRRENAPPETSEGAGLRYANTSVLSAPAFSFIGQRCDR
jgi:hypothetical protein